MLAHLQNDPTAALGQDQTRHFGSVTGLPTSVLASRIERSLGLIGRDPCNLLENPARQVPGRRRIENQRHTLSRAKRGQILHGFERDLELCENNTRLSNDLDVGL